MNDADRRQVNSPDIVEAAKLVRPYLADLLGPEDAEELDRGLGGVLAERQSAAVAAGRLSALLAEHEPVLQWVEDLLDDPRRMPPELQTEDVRGAGYEAAAGHGEPVPADRFVCPAGGDVIWYRRRIGMPVPRCGTHGCPLVRG